MIVHIISLCLPRPSRGNAPEVLVKSATRVATFIFLEVLPRASIFTSFTSTTCPKEATAREPSAREVVDLGQGWPGSRV
jgi:hypothetical protein